MHRIDFRAETLHRFGCSFSTALLKSLRSFLFSAQTKYQYGSEVAIHNTQSPRELDSLGFHQPQM